MAMQTAFNSAISSAARKAPGNAAHAADHHHHEGLADRHQVEAEVGRLARQLQRAAQPGEEGAEREHAR